MRLQVKHGKNGFSVEVGDVDACSKYLYELWTDKELRERISVYAGKCVSDEVSTVGNALNWLFLAKGAKEGKGSVVKPGGRWVADLAREDAGFPYGEGEPRLPRDVSGESF